MRRTRTNKRKDKRIFKQTAQKTKNINTGNVVMRGGIRL
jgi:hypothetical protein